MKKPVLRIKGFLDGMSIKRMQDMIFLFMQKELTATQVL